MVLAVLISDAPLIFFFSEMHWTALQIVYFAKSGFFHKDMNLVFQQFFLFPSAIISDNAVLVSPPTQKQRKTIQ